MKAIIMPVLIILALIVFFVMIDRREFKRYNDIQTEQRERAESNWRPTPVTGTETKPAVDENPVAETKPIAETKPASESKPVVETKPVAETKPAVETKTTAKPVETNPGTASKPVAAAKPADPNAPMAVPVVSAEEAAKLNAEALKQF